MFDIKQFSSGEWDVKITERLSETVVTIHWNWFDKSQRDLMQLLLKIDAIRANYPSSQISILAPYLPYLRQDRIFEVGQGIPASMLVNLFNRLNVRVETYAPHSEHAHIVGTKFNLEHLVYDYNIVFPDNNASKHYLEVGEYISFTKTRIDNGITLQTAHVPQKIHTERRFLICDDICAGGRTFVECANVLRSEWGDGIAIELMVYNAFLDYGLDKLKESGISRVHIINPDSYAHICDLYPEDVPYFNYITIEKGE